MCSVFKSLGVHRHAEVYRELQHCHSDCRQKTAWLQNCELQIMGTYSSVAQQTSVFDAKLEIRNGGIKEKWSEKEVVARQKPLSSLRIQINVCLRFLSVTEI